MNINGYYLLTLHYIICMNLKRNYDSTISENKCLQIMFYLGGGSTF